tara:strand:+ start:1086 stop:1496 length:411 start_codon:yes stop_codon:yes gene_type:complete
MASLEQGIRSILIADTDVSALVVARVFPWMRQQGTVFPAIVYELDGIEPEQGLGGYQSLTRAELSISSVAETYGGAKTLSAHVRDALNGYTGTPTDGLPIKSLVHDNDIGIVEDSQIGNSRGVTVIESSYIIWYSD